MEQLTREVYLKAKLFFYKNALKYMLSVRLVISTVFLLYPLFPCDICLCHSPRVPKVSASRKYDLMMHHTQYSSNPFLNAPIECRFSPVLSSHTPSLSKTPIHLLFHLCLCPETSRAKNFQSR